MLGADALALAAADAVRGAGAGPGVDILIVVVRVPVVVGVLRVHDGEQVGDGDMLRAAVGAVAAGRAGDQILLAEDLHHLGNGGTLGIVQRRKVLHVAQVVLHLLHAAHAGQHHQHTGEARGKPDGIAGGAAAVQGVQHGFCVVGQVDKAAALDRLHDQHGLAMPAADLIALAALDGHVVIVQIIELDLHDLDGRIVGQNLLQHGGAVMERDAHMADLALGLEGEGRLIGAAVPVVLVVCHALGVHQIKVKVVHAAGCKLALKERADVLFLFKIGPAQLVGQDIVLPRVTAGQALLQGQLALALKVAVGRVKIIEALLQKAVHHLFCLLYIDVLADHGQAHTAEAEILPDLFHL